VISEKSLAVGYSSVWRSLLPLGESFTRHVNSQLERFAAPMRMDAKAVRVAIVSELGFRFFSALLGGSVYREGGVVGPIDKRESLELEAVEYIAGMQSSTDTGLVTREEQSMAMELANRIQTFLSMYEPDSFVVASPSFRGCGFVDDCNGDLLVGDTLYEIKNVERQFRAIDIRQLLVYCGLAKSDGGLRFKYVGLLNARHGTFIKLSIDQVAFGLSGVSGSDLLEQIIKFISREQTSR
jgi:hypothetical protein